MNFKEFDFAYSLLNTIIQSSIQFIKYKFLNTIDKKEKDCYQMRYISIYWSIYPEKEKKKLKIYHRWLMQLEWDMYISDNGNYFEMPFKKLYCHL